MKIYDPNALELDAIKRELGRPDNVICLDQYRQFIMLRNTSKEKALRRAKWRSIMSKRRMK